jgi:hypothetical protein
VRQLLECAATKTRGRTVSSSRDVVDAMFWLPAPDVISPCRGDVVLHRWRPAAPKPEEMGEGGIALLRRLPLDAEPAFLWSSARWFRTIVDSKTRFGATMFECEETNAQIQLAKAAVVVDSDSDSEDLLVPSAKRPKLQMSLSRTLWLSTQIRCISAVDASRQQNKEEDGSTALYCTVQAGQTTRSIVESLATLSNRLSLCRVHASGFGLCGISADYVYRHLIDQDDGGPPMPSVLVLFTSVWHRCRYKEALQEWRRLSRGTLSIETLVFDELLGTLHWSTRVRVELTHRFLVVDAHRYCEHDKAKLLAILANKTSAAALVVLCGDVDQPVPAAHRESGAPFMDMCTTMTDVRVVDIYVVAREENSVPKLAAAFDVPSMLSDHIDSLCRHALLTHVRTMVSAMLRGEAHWVIVAFGGVSNDDEGAGSKYSKRSLTLSAACKLIRTCLQRFLSVPPDNNKQSAKQRSLLDDTSRELERLEKTPWQLDHSLLIAAPFVIYESVLMRVTSVFRLTRQPRRHELIDLRVHLADCTTTSAVVSLDASDLYLELDEAQYGSVDGAPDHRDCCLTAKANVLCVSAHRSVLRGASIVAARDLRPVELILANKSVMLLLPPVSPTAHPVNVFGADLDGEQLLATQIRSVGSQSPCLAMMHATEEQVAATRLTLRNTVTRSHSYAPPLTTLHDALEKSRCVL